MSDQDKSPDWVAGYQARCREEVETYLRLVESGHQVYDRVIRGLVEAPTFLERETSRLAVLAEAHAAELHVGRPVLDVPGRAGCPVCMEAYAAVVGPGRCYARGHVQGHLGPFRGGCDVWLPNGNNRGEVPAHNGDYGAAQNGAYFDPCPTCGGCCLEHGEYGGEHAPAAFNCSDHTGLTALPRPVPDARAVACSELPGCGELVHSDSCEVALAEAFREAPIATLQPPPCKRHAGEGNQLNCPDCGRRRQDHYARLGG